MPSACCLGDLNHYYASKCVARCGLKMEARLRWLRIVEDVSLHTVGDAADQSVHQTSRAVFVESGSIHDP
jgi:hypothetical protein